MLAASSGSVKMKYAMTALLQVFAQLSPAKAVAALSAREHFDTLNSVMDTYMGSSQHLELQAAASSALASLAKDDAAVKKAVAAGAIEAVAAAMTAHPRSAEVQAAASSALASLAKDDAAVKKAVAAGAIEAVAAAMTAHPRSAEVQAAASSALASLAKDDAAVKKAVAAGAIEAVAAAMTAHPRSAEVHAAAVYFIKAVWPGENRLSSYWWHHSYNSAEYTNVVPKLQAIPIDTIIRTFPNGPAIEVKAYAYFRDGAMKRFWPSA